MGAACGIMEENRNAYRLLVGKPLKRTYVKMGG
jgi:hypothetical protein